MGKNRRMQKTEEGRILSKKEKNLNEKNKSENKEWTLKEMKRKHGSKKKERKCIKGNSLKKLYKKNIV